MTVERVGRDDGFTLLELLVALAVFALVVVALSGGVRFAGSAIDAAARHDADRGDLAAVRTALRRIISTGRLIEGGPRAMRWLATMPAALELPGFYEIDLVVVDDRLLLRWQPHRREAAEEQAAGDAGEAELARGIADAAFDYFTQQKSGGAWQSVADVRRNPPLLVRLRFAGEGGRRWPEIVAAPGTDTALPGVG